MEAKKVPRRRLVGFAAPSRNPARYGERSAPIPSPGMARARDILRVALPIPAADSGSPETMLREMNLVAARGSEPEIRPEKTACTSARAPTIPTSVGLRILD